MGIEARPARHHRELFAIGIEHNVYRAHGVKDTDVLKTPRRLNALTMLGRDMVVVIRQELEEAQGQVEGTSVIIPRTKVYPFGHDRLFGTRGYVMRQQLIQDDGSVADIPGDLKRQGLETLADEYVHEPRNFISHESFIYWVDPTKGPIGRVLESSGIMDLPTYRIIRRKLTKVIRFLGL